MCHMPVALELFENPIKIPGYAMATTAIHKLGDISREEPDLCYLKEEKDDCYIGEWVTGLGFVEVIFPKDTTRPLTKEEIEKYNKKSVVIGNGPGFTLKVD